ncbi:HpsJ family protein [[Phormidium] sp. ETS-05]|uniref:HpsJ family protein n=1 Tax=[Phormidium] sp. ETS-05 TaxID=222819 RepID=UPI0018EEF507|nr:HpsJ family protein [[Phormidium] sp. ETS-05]
MKATDSELISRQASRLLKQAGTVLIVISLLDLVMLPFPLELGDVRWRLNLTTQLIERGIVPMLGMALVFSGYGFETLTGAAYIKPKKLRDLKLWVFLISSFLGFIFIVLAPAHAFNAFSASNDAIAGFKKDAQQAEQQLEERLKRQQTEIASILSNQQRLDDFIKSDNFNEEQLAKLKEFQNDPEALAKQTEAIRDNAKKEIEKRRKEAEGKSRTGALKSSFRLGISSLLLASCYITIGWTGLKSEKKPRRPRG